MQINAYQLQTFTKDGAGGNEAGVVLGADGLTETMMKQIAAQLGFSETAFVLQSDHADCKVRFFTPNEEVDFCGHATVGTFFTFSRQGLLQPGKYSQETKAGVFAVEVTADLTIMMNQPLPRFYETIDPQAIAASLKIAVADLAADLPVQAVSTGLKDILVPVKNLDVLRSIAPDFEKVAAISRQYQAIGYHVFTLETLHGSTAHCRNFAPLYGIPEESATGTSNGALACFLYQYGRIDPNQARNIIIEQGYSMQKPSEILAALSIANGTIAEVKVGGKAANLTLSAVEI